jgi:hypothetical protein
VSHRIQKIAKISTRGNLRIGDHWNAITIIALSQSNPLKAVAELVENSIDARAKANRHHPRQGQGTALAAGEGRRRGRAQEW